MGRHLKSLLLLSVVLATSTASAEAPAQRIATLAPHLAELVCAAGGCARLVAVSEYSNYPASVTKLPQLGGAWNINLEAVLAQRPDLVIAWTDGTPPDQVARLQKLGLRVVWLQANTLDSIGAALEMVGGWLGTKEAAAKAANDYRQRLAGLRAQHRDEPAIRAVYQIETSPAYTISAASPISEVMSLCGGINVFAALPTISAAIGQEAMLAAAPEVVLYGREESAAAIRAYWARLGSAPVAQAGNLFPIDPDLLGRAGPRMLDGVVAVCAAFDQARSRLAEVRRRPTEPGAAAAH
ncbi:helical backbone metal receptor [Nevskia sp.]|uniref:helical backbone metal receptor n=1 Tax=Nevskia sp. TaxID=1929292 RepID=UPI0025D951FF|nr:helical backbone metal receptor [Nevskia sp.]